MLRTAAVVSLATLIGACSDSGECGGPCPATLECVEGTCRPPCNEDKECPSGEICNGVCMPGERPPLPDLCPTPTVISNDVLIDQQSDQAVFQSGCIIVRGDLEIIGAPLDIIFLAGIAGVQGSVRVAQNPELDSLYGLQNLRRVEGDLVIVDNDDLRSIILPALETIGGKLEVRRNLSLDDADCEQFLLRVQARGGSTCER